MIQCMVHYITMSDVHAARETLFWALSSCVGKAIGQVTDRLLTLASAINRADNHRQIGNGRWRAPDGGERRRAAGANGPNKNRAPSTSLGAF